MIGKCLGFCCCWSFNFFYLCPYCYVCVFIIFDNVECRSSSAWHIHKKLKIRQNSICYWDISYFFFKSFCAFSYVLPSLGFVLSTNISGQWRKWHCLLGVNVLRFLVYLFKIKWLSFPNWSQFTILSILHNAYISSTKFPFHFYNVCVHNWLSFLFLL